MSRTAPFTAPKLCVPKKWQQVQRIANRATEESARLTPFSCPICHGCRRKRGAGLDRLKAVGDYRLPGSSWQRKRPVRRSRRSAQYPNRDRMTICRSSQLALMSRAARRWRVGVRREAHRQGGSGHDEVADPQIARTSRRVAVARRSGGKFRHLGPFHGL